jgi:hypothetical protein
MDEPQPSALAWTLSLNQVGAIEALACSRHRAPPGELMLAFNGDMPLLTNNQRDRREGH